MNSKILLVCLMLAIAAIGRNSQSYGDESLRIYISPDQLRVSQDGIFVIIDGEMIQPQAILQDSDGLYFARPTIFWSCSKCGYGENPAWTNYCQNCKKRYDE